MREIFARGVFYWLRAPRWHADVRNDERTLVVARLLLCMCCLGAMVSREAYVPPAHHIKLLFEYLVYSLVILAVFRVYRRWHHWVYVAVHCADILWAAYLIIRIGDLGVFFALSAFVMVAASVRWGFCEVLATAFLSGILMFLVHLCDAIPLLPDHLSGFDIVPLGILGFAIIVTVGLLAEAKAIHSEVYSIHRITWEIRLQNRLESAIRHLNFNCSQLFGAELGLVALHNKKTGQSWLHVNAENAAQSREVRSFPYDQYFFPVPAAAYRMERTVRNERVNFRCHVLSEGNVSRDKTGFGLPDAFLSEHPFRRLLALSLDLGDLGDELSIRIFAVNPTVYFGGTAGLRFLEKEWRLAAPAISDLVLAGRLRLDAEAATSSRIARDLHDGVIQSLAGINLQLEELRAKTVSVFPQSEDPLLRVQQSVQKEIVALREFTQQLRSYEIDSSNFLGYLSGLAVKFQSEHGIATRFVPEIESVTLQPLVCGELARIVLEALVNVRKHSRASEVFIRLGHRNGDLVISVLDNGCGFGFTGHRTHDELLASGTGPVVILERARNIHARASIESVEGSGTCLEICLPR